MIILNFIIFFVFDLLCFVLLKEWLISSLLVYFFSVIFFKKKVNISIKILAICLFFIQDYIIYGTVGVSLFYILPILFFNQKLIKMLNFSSFFVFIPFIGIVFLAKIIFLDILFFNKYMGFHSTFLNIFNSMLIGCLILLGSRDNHS